MSMAGFVDKLPMEQTNFLVYEMLILGVSYRWDNSINPNNP